MHQQGFGIVIGGMSGGNFAGQAAQKGISCLPGSCLQTLRPGNHLRTAGYEVNSVACAKVPDKGLVPVGFFPPEPVVEEVEVVEEPELVAETV